MDEQTQSPIVTPAESQPQNQQPLAPHRGVSILVLGIVGLVVGLFGSFCCGVFGIAGLICGIIAWVMSNNDLKQMDTGVMDPSGRGLTQAGKICGIISVILSIVLFIISLLFIGFIGLFHLVEQQPS